MAYKKRTFEESPIREKINPTRANAEGSRPTWDSQEGSKSNWTKHKWKRAKQHWLKRPNAKNLIY